MPTELYRALFDKDLSRYLRGPDHSYADGNCLYLRVRQHRGNWLYRYAGADGKPHDLALGSYRPETPGHPRHLTLKQAREKAAEQHHLRQQGHDPLGQRQAARTTARVEAARAALPTLRECYEEWEVRHLNSRGRYRRNCDAEMANHVYPMIGRVRIDEVTRDHIEAVLKPIWHRIPDTAQRIRGRLEQTLKYATAQRWRTGDNPADGDLMMMIFGSVDREVRNHARVEPEGVPEFMKMLRHEEGIAARCAEAVVLSAMRSSNIRLVHWTQIDYGNNTLTIPRYRPGIEEGRALKRDMGKFDFRVPLTPRLREIFKELEGHRRNRYVFPGSNAEVLVTGALRDAVYPLVPRGSMTMHGFRSAFRDWASAQLTPDGIVMFDDTLCEVAIAHKVGDATKRAYLRSDALEARKPLMEMWDAYCRS